MNPRSLPFGQRVVWARKRKGISQERLAELAGTTRRNMIRIEKGQTRRPRPALVARIAEATGQRESFFADDDEDEEAALASPRERDILKALRPLARELARTEAPA